MNNEEAEKQHQKRMALVLDTFREDIQNAVWDRKNPEIITFEDAQRAETVNRLRFCTTYAGTRMKFEDAVKTVKDKNLYTPI